jgi:hypothetical protein
MRMVNRVDMFQNSTGIIAPSLSPETWSDVASVYAPNPGMHPAQTASAYPTSGHMPL